MPAGPSGRDGQEKSRRAGTALRKIARIYIYILDNIAEARSGPPHAVQARRRVQNICKHHAEDIGRTILHFSNFWDAAVSVWLPKLGIFSRVWYM